MGNIDILVVTESKLDQSFPSGQFNIDGYSPPFRYDRNSFGGGVIIFVREDIPCRELFAHMTSFNIEGIFLEINLRKSKWLLFGGYNPSKSFITDFLKQLGTSLDIYLSKYDNVLLLGDFNSESIEPAMVDFEKIYNLKNLIKEPTCFKNPSNPSSIDVILSNRCKRFFSSMAIETGLSDHHKLTITSLKQYFPKQKPIIIHFRDYSNFDLFLFKSELSHIFTFIGNEDINYQTFENTVMDLLNQKAPIKKKYIRANNAPFMNKTLSKAVMTRSRIRNRYLRNLSVINKNEYKRYRNFCDGLFRKEKRRFYENIDTNKITDNRIFWKTVKPLFSEKHILNKKITLVEKNDIVSNDADVAEIMNLYFSFDVQDLAIDGYAENLCSSSVNSDPISKIIVKFKDHPSILKIKERIIVKETFRLPTVNEKVISAEINSLNKRKPTSFNNIPIKLLMDTCDISSSYITTIYNNSITNSCYPSPLKWTDITPVHKKGDRSLKSNYRPISILPSVSKIFERIIHEQILIFVEQYLSPYLCGFRKGYSTQYYLIIMLERWKKALNNRKIAGALLTDLSKAFDCLNHELLIAKLEAYGFHHSALTYIFSYLSDRKQRTKVNNFLSSWSNIETGVLKGSILGPLIFNIYMNDIVYFIREEDLANYADDNTPYAIENEIETLISIIEKDASILIKWFKDNYLKLNEDKCKLLITKHNDNVSAKIGSEIITASESVKLLGIIIDNKLNFNEHISKLFKKVSQKIHALARISNFMSTEKLIFLFTMSILW